MEHCKHIVMDKCKKSGFPCTFSENCFEPEEPLVKTNADRLRSMTDEELAEVLSESTYCSPVAIEPCNSQCKDCWMMWLKQTAKED